MINTKKLSVRDMCHIGIFTAIISVLAQISIPMPYGVPMTLQTFAIPLAGIVLGAKNGALSALVYVLLGAIGAPVFAGFSGGFGIILGPTGGFILSFPVVAFTAGIGAGKSSELPRSKPRSELLRGNKAWLASWLAGGAAINYICGMLMFVLVTSSGLDTAFAACVLPFIPTTVVKTALAALLGGKIKKMVKNI